MGSNALPVEATFGSPVEWVAEQLQAIPVEPARRAVVLVAAERQAHAIRRRLCVECGQPSALAGVLFLRPAELAREVLLRAGRARMRGWSDVRRLHMLQLFESGELAGALRYFSAEQLRSGRGYADAFARTIADLEASGLTAALASAVADRLADHDRRAADRLCDVATAWRAAEARRPPALITAAQLLAEASEMASVRRDLLAAFGPVFALLTTAPSTVLLRFLRALPDCRALLQEARPRREDTQRWRQLLQIGRTPSAEDAASNQRTPAAQGVALSDDRPALPELRPERFVDAEGQEPQRGGTSVARGIAPGSSTGGVCAAELTVSELRLVHRYLFELPETLTDPERPRSHGVDGTVDLEEYPSIEDEIEAAAIWVTEQIATGIAAEQIALVVPEIDPYAGLLADRLGRLPFSDGESPLRTCIAGGMALAASAAGMRFQTLLQALARGLEAEATIRLLPALRRTDQDDDAHVRLSPSRAAEIVYGAGIVGGTPGDPAGMTEWLDRLNRRRDALRSLIETADTAGSGGSEEPVTIAVRDRQQADRWLRDVEPILPAIAELQDLAESIRGGGALVTIWPALRAFTEGRLRIPPEPPNFFAVLEQRLQFVLSDPVARGIAGFAAVSFLIDFLRRERQAATRFGEPCVFVGTAAQASGLSFAAVRVLGLAEGALPHSPHDDPIVPDGLRLHVEMVARGLQAAPDIVIPRLADRVLDEIHDVFRVISGAQQHVALSAPRQWVDRSEREVSGIMLEVATALGRTQAPGVTGVQPGDNGDVPTAARLRAAYFNLGRAARRRAAGTAPISPRAVCDPGLFPAEPCGPPTVPAVAVPIDWTHDGPLAVDKIHRLQAVRNAGALTPTNGIVTDTWTSIPPPGLDAQHPISASALILLLGCPYRFLLERVLHLAKPKGRPSTDVLDPAVYGSLFHAAAECFYREAGVAVCRREGRLDEWVARAQAIAAAQFEQLRDSYPLRGEDGIARERSRLLRQIEELVLYEWHASPREFLASEWTFGEPHAVTLDVGTGSLYVRGKIDRVDRLGARALAVCDLKTGRVRDFGEEPLNAARDLQIGLYVLAVEAVGYGGAPVTSAAYVHPSAVQEPARAFTGPHLDILRQQTREWLCVARQLLAAGLFPRTPNAEDCMYCPFVSVCGDGAQQRAASAFATLPPAHVLEPFVRLKQRRVEEEG